MFGLFSSSSSQELILQIVVKVGIIFLILPVHEFAHAWAAKKLGDDTALYQGRLTLNPLSHVDPIGALCLLVTGFGWAKPVPVNPIRFKNQRKGMALTALAGPVSNLIMALIAMLALRIVQNTELYSNLLMQYVNGENSLYLFFYMIQYFISINIGLAIFNLLPIPPLDGSKIIGYFTSYKFDRMIEQYYMYIQIAFMVLIFTGALSRPISFLSNAMYNLFILLTNWVNIFF